MDHTHENLEKELVIITIPGDVALGLANVIKFAMRHHFAEDLVYCKGDENMIERLEEFGEKLDKKCKERGLTEIMD